MASNYKQPGNSIDFANAGSAISSGDVVVIGSLIGVALVDIAASTGTGAVAIEGVFTLPKKTTDTFTAGQKLTWDISEGELTEGVAAAGDIVDGCVAIAAAGGSATTVDVKLTPGTGVVEPVSG